MKVAAKMWGQHMTRVTGNCCSLLVIVGLSKLALAHLLMAQLTMDPATLGFSLDKTLGHRAARHWIQLDNKWDWTRPSRPKEVSLKRGDTVQSWYRAALTRTMIQRTRRHRMRDIRGMQWEWKLQTLHLNICPSNTYRGCRTIASRGAKWYYETGRAGANWSAC